jgi:DNA-binding NtrC family response regulator
MATHPKSASERKPSLLIVDDDALITDTLAFALGADFDVHCCESRRQAIDLLRKLPEPPQLALVDLGLPPAPHSPEEGFQLIADLLAHSPEMRIFVLSGQNDAANARRARTLGAAEFIAKPCDPATLRRMLARALEFRAAEIAGLPAGADELIGASPAIAKLKSQISQFADSPFPVLIEGESGSGKELVAASLHRLSSRAARPYFALNCAAIAPTLVEPTLFGYTKGAFTGATANKSGYFEDAQDGTLFLDEIGELPLELQAKLLRVLENGEYQRVGETQTRVSRARAIAATNRDLRHETKNGAFRADLYHRLSVFTLAVPPLREMDGDKIGLLDHFRRLYAGQSGVQPFTLDEAAVQRWLDYAFPGNVRELRNIVIRLTTKYAGQRLSVAEVDPEFDVESDAAGPPIDGAGRDIVEQALKHLERGGYFHLDEMLKAWERGYIDAALKIARGNVSQAARLLGVNRTTLYSRMEARTGTGEPEGGSPVPPPQARSR